MINSPIRFKAMSSSAFTGAALPLPSLSDIDPGDRLLTPLLEPENLDAQLPRGDRNRANVPQGNLTACVTVHQWPSPAGPSRQLNWRWKSGHAMLAPITTAHQQFRISN